MDRGPALTPTDRRRIRRMITKRCRYFPGDPTNARWAALVYSYSGAKLAYALAYLGALETCEPLNWDRVRDSRS